MAFGGAGFARTAYAGDDRFIPAAGGGGSAKVPWHLFARVGFVLMLASILSCGGR